MAIKISGSTIIDDTRAIVNADKIGIGQTTPSYDLEIFSTGTPTGIAVSATSTQTTDTNKAISIFNNSSTLAFSASYRGRVDAQEYHGVFKGTIDTGVSISKADTIDITDDTSGSGTHYIHFGSATDGYDGVEVDSTGLVYKDGKFGIGTNNPTQELTLYGNDPIISVQEASVSSQVDMGTGTVTGFINIQKADGTRTVQITGNGKSYFTGGGLGIGTVDQTNYGNAVKLALHSTGHTGFTIAAGTSSDSNIFFADGITGDATYRGNIKYAHNGDSMRFHTAAEEQLRITSDGFVGIGTDNPATKLDVQDGDITIRNGAEHNAIRTTPDGKLQFLRNAASNNTVSVTIDDADGSVGIGSTIPGAGLDIIVDTNPVLSIDRGSANNTNFNLKYNGNHYGQISVANQAFQLSAIGANTPIDFYVNGSERLSISTDGDLLRGGTGQDIGASNAKWDNIYANTVHANIQGTITPTGSITITDDLTVNGNTTLGSDSSDTLTVNAISTFNETSSFISDDGIFIKSSSNSPTNGAQIKFSDYPNDSYSQVGHIKYLHSNGAVSPNTDEGFLIGGSETLSVVKVEGRVLVDEKVGIGTNNPRNDLLKINHAGTDTPVTALTISGENITTGGGSGIFLKASTDVLNDDRYGSRIHTIREGTNNGATSLVISNENSDSSRLEERLRITSAGQVGIGTTNPSQMLTVRGTILKTRGDSGVGLIYLQADGSQNGQIVVNQNGGVTRVKLDSAAESYFNGGKLLVSHTSVLHSGNLQVSTSSEDAIDINAYSSTADEGGRLSFYRSKNASIGSNTVVANGDSLGRIDFRGYNNNNNSYNQGATIEAVVDGSVNESNDMPTAILFKTSGDSSANPDERLRIDKDGKVGIGTNLTTTPTSTLTVAPYNSTSGRNISLYTSGSVGNKAGLFFNSTPATGNLAEIQAEYKGTNQGELVLSTSMQKRITIKKDGEVGINTTTVYDTNTMLQVNGKTGAGPNLVLHRNDTSVSAGQVLGALRITGNDSNGTQQESSAIEFVADLDHGTDDKPGRIVFKTADDGASSATEKVRINSDGDLLRGGTGQDIGASGAKWDNIYANKVYADIEGSITPSGSITITNDLTVNGNTTLGSDSSDTLTVNADATFNDELEVLGTDASALVHFNGHSRGGIAAFSKQQVAFVSTTVNDDLLFGYSNNPPSGANFVPRMKIDNGTGYVSIGHTSPATKLDVKQNNGVAYDGNAQNVAYGAARFFNESGHVNGGTYTGFQFNITGNSQNRICSIGMISEASNSKASSLVFHTDDNGNRTEKLRIDSGGRLYTGASQTSLDTTAGTIHIDGGTSGGRIALRGTTTSAETGIAEVFAFWDTNKVAGMIAKSGTDTTNKDDGSLHFYTRPDANGVQERLTITSGGQVRIANTDLTTNSSADDLIVGTTSGSRGLTIFSGTGNTGNIFFADTDTSGVGNRMGTITYDHGGNFMRFSTSGNQEKLRITSTGDVGIGTTNPDGRLHVLGNSRFVGITTFTDDIFVGTDGKLLVGTTSGNNNNIIHARLANGSIANTSNQSVILAENDTNAWITIGSGASNYGGILFADSDSSDVGQVRYDHDNNALEFLTNGGNASNIRLKIDSSGHLLPGGTSQDIGSSSSRWNDIFAVNANFSGTVTYESVTDIDAVGVITARDHIKFANSGDGIIFGTEGSSDRPSIIGTYAAADDNHMSFNTTGDERFRITKDGKFSLGTINATPSAAVHIDYESNNLLMLDNATGSTQKMFFAQSGGTHAQIYGTSASGALTIESDPSANHDNSFIDFRVDNEEAIRIEAGGNVGIGTHNPECILDISKSISGGVNNVDIRNHHATGGAALRVKTQGTYASPTYQAILGASDAGGTIRVGAVSNHDLLLLTNNDAKVTIKSGGKVGIGTVNPVANARLDVWGDGSEYPTLRLGTEAYNTQGEDIRFGRIDHPQSDIRYHSIYSFHHADADKNYLKFSVHKGAVGGNNTLQADIMHLKGDGNVGINEASNINGRLHVQHDALAENILYATRHNDQTNDKPILAITEAQMTGMAANASGLVIGNHNRDIHIGQVFDSSATVDTSGVKGIRITNQGNVGIGTNNPTGAQALTGNNTTLAVGNLIAGNITGPVTGEASKVTIANGSDNRVITAASSNTLNAETNLTFDGSTLFANGNITAANDGDKDNQTNIALTVRHSTNSAMRGNHLIVDDFPSGSGTYFIQATESGVTNDRNMCIQGYGGKVKIGALTEPTETLDVTGNVKATSINLANTIFHTGDTDTLMEFGTNTIKFETAGSERLSITSAGMVGIAKTLRLESNISFGDSNTTLVTSHIYVRGTGLNNDAFRQCTLNGSDQISGSNRNNRGLHLIIYDATNSLTKDSGTTYDTHGSGTSSNNLATAIDGMDRTKIGVLVSYDAFTDNITDNLRNSAQKVGLFKLAGMDTGTVTRQPYAAIFRGTSDDTNAEVNDAIEVIQSDDADAPTATISTFITVKGNGENATITGAYSVSALVAPAGGYESPLLQGKSSTNSASTLTIGAGVHLLPSGSAANDGDTSGVDLGGGSNYLRQIYVRKINADSVVGPVTGAASQLKITNQAGDETCFPVFVQAATGDTLTPHANTSLTFNALTGQLGATSFSGGLPITDGANNRIITATSGSAIKGESDLTFDGSTLAVTGGGNPVAVFDRGSANNTNLNLKYNGNHYGQISVADKEFQLSAVGAATTFKVFVNGTDRFMIDVNGNIGVNATPKTSGTLYSTVDHFLVIGDNDTGIAQDGDGQLEIWANDQEIANFNTSNITLKKATTIQDNLTVNGTITYEDVTNVSTTGIVTAAVFIATGGTVDSGTETDPTNVAMMIEKDDYIYTNDSVNSKRKLIGKTGDEVIQIGDNTTFLIEQIKMLPGASGTVSIGGTLSVRNLTPTPGVHFEVKSDKGMLIRTDTNSGSVSGLSGSLKGAKLLFSDSGSLSQIGHIVYKHADNSITPGTNEGFIIGGDQGTSSNPTVVKVEGRVVVDEKVGIGTINPLHPLHISSAMGSSPSFIHMQVTGSNTVGGGGGIAFDTSASSNDSNNSLFLATIAGIRNSANNGSNDLVFSTSKANVNSNLPAEKLRITMNGGIAFNGATNYGTSGQILKSNGDAPPTWIDSSTVAPTVDVKQYKVGSTERSCTNPITVNSGTIGITSASNAFGARYISTEGTSGTYCDGDIWYDTTGADELEASGTTTSEIFEASKFFQNPTSLTQTTTFPTSGSKNGGVFGPYEIANGVTLTISSGSTFTII